MQLNNRKLAGGKASIAMTNIYVTVCIWNCVWHRWT